MKSKYLKYGFFVFFLLFLGITFFSFQKNISEQSIDDIEEPVYQETRKLDLVMVGDALYHDGVYKDGYTNQGTYDFKKQLQAIKPIVSQYDLAYYNQESILGGTSLGLSTYPRFNSPYEVGDAFLDAGFNLVSTANNHTLDRGCQAILNSYQYFQGKNNVLMSGTCDSVECVTSIPVGETNGISYAFLSYTTTTNGLKAPKGEEYLVNVYSDERVRRDVLAIQDQVDVILVAMHWGSEYHDYPTKEQRTIANYLASLGVDIVIGNHPHVIEPIERIGDTLVFYSFGNFISAQTGSKKLIGLMGSVSIIKTIVGEEEKIDITNLQTRLTYTSYNSRFRNFQILPFSEVSSSMLPNKTELEKNIKALVQSYGVEPIWTT